MKLPKLVLGDLVLDLPIIQGGMGVGVSKASLAGAVSSEGGLGVIASVGLGEEIKSEKDYLTRSDDALTAEIRKVKQRKVPVGVNIMVALTNYRHLVEACVREKVDVIISGAGLPMRLPEYAGNSPVKLVPIVSSVRAANIIFKVWLRKHDRLPDAVVIEGPLAGGHLGFSFEDLASGKAESLSTILKGMVPFVKEHEKRAGRKIPIIVAGGVYTGQDIADFLAQGASGVQMATRFVATEECDTSDEYKQAFVKAKKEDVIIIRSPVGMPARVIKNAFVEQRQKGEKSSFSCPYQCLLSCEAKSANYCIADALLNASRGHMDRGFPMCGQNVYRIDKIVTVKALIQELIEGAMRRA